MLKPYSLFIAGLRQITINPANKKTVVGHLTSAKYQFNNFVY